MTSDLSWISLIFASQKSAVASNSEKKVSANFCKLSVPVFTGPLHCSIEARRKCKKIRSRQHKCSFPVVTLNFDIKFS
jgi:hypothetical protein